MEEPSVTTATLLTSGEAEGAVNVSIGPRFLELFSENLYSSPNKAFEELVANSWDAGARCAHIHIPRDLPEPNAAIWVIDDGESMDFAGLQQLWAVASSNKRALPSPPRPQIGKFGIGKLATYILANEVTYICKAADGLIRAVSMDYRRIARENAAALHTEPLPLQVRRLSESDLRSVLSTFPESEHLISLIEGGLARPSAHFSPEEDFGGAPIPAPLGVGSTWTLALLTSLKREGQAIEAGRLRWILRTALPLGSSITVVLNGETLESSKVDTEVAEEWRLGENLGITEIIYNDEVTLKVEELRLPYNHVIVEGIPGRITGRILLFKDKISGGKSEAIGASNGFFVNVLGRVINYQNTDFGLDNLSHGAWAHFRATVRVDGLDDALSVERDGLRENRGVTIFKLFLRVLFNKARTAHSSLEAASWPNAGDILEKSWNILPLLPLAKVVSERLGSSAELPDSIDATGIEDQEKLLSEWNTLKKERPGELITDIRHQELTDDQPLAKYDLAERSVIINAAHPFYREHSTTHEEKLILRDIALVDFLSDAYMLDIGIDSGLHRDYRRYRDQLLRLLAQLSRRTGPQIAKMLIDSTSHPKGLEIAVGEALRYLGFQVTDIGGKGEPEGVAKAPLTPGHQDKQLAYSFTYEAKSTSKSSERVSNKEVGAGRLARHREKYGADYSLVVAPDYELGVLQEECAASGVTPIRARDLAKLLMFTAEIGILDLERFRTIFTLRDPDHVADWIAQTSTPEQPNRLTIDVFLSIIDEIGFEGPDTLSAQVIADRIRMRKLPGVKASRAEIRQLVSGLQILIPSIVRIAGDEVFLSASPSKIRAALLEQIGKLPGGLGDGIKKSLGEA